MTFAERYRIGNPGMIQVIGEAATLEQLAEECSELAKAALKLARIERGENPTPVTQSQAIDDLIEEYSDVWQVAHLELGLHADLSQIIRKRDRFNSRVFGMDEENSSAENLADGSRRGER